MRKLVIALIIVLPMVFVLVLFSSANLVSISVKVSVNGIQLFKDEDPIEEGEVIYLDMAEKEDHTVTAEVTPANAYERGYTLESDNPDVLTISQNGYITALSEGTANVKATSYDKGFTASVPVVVTSSKAYGVAFSLYDGEGNAVKMNFNNSNSTYTVRNDIAVGTYTYKVDIFGGESKAYDLKVEDDPYEIKAIINEGDESIMLPFSGSATLKLEVPDAIVNGMTGQTLRSTINLRMAKASSESGIVVNGVPDGNTVLLAKGATKATMYVECEGEPELTGDGIESVRCLVHDAQAHAVSAGASTSAADENCHKLEVTLKGNVVADDLQATLTAAGKSLAFKLSFADFDFDLRSSIMHGGAGEYGTVILKDTDTTIYAVPAVELQDVEYVWSTNDDALTISPTNDSRSNCLFNATRDGEYKVTVQAKRGGENLGAAKQLSVTVTTKVNSVWINNATDVDLADHYTVGGKKFGDGDNIVANDSYAIKIMVSKKGSAPRPNDYEGIEIVSSNEEVATVTMRDNMAYLQIKDSGRIEVTARWKYNEEFGGKATQSITLNVVADAVEVSNYPDLRAATENGNKVVLTSNIMLGTDKSGQALSIDERKAIAAEHMYNSNYNTAWYKQNNNLDKAKVTYALEFTNDVYGNGKYLDAEYFTNAVDASGRPLIFTGPLSFVGFGEDQYSAARVAAQDNCAFLIRTDGIKLYGVNLRGCSDESLYEGNNYELNHLNYVGNTLEVNADCDIINCRLQNGRNVLRAYGGNREADLDPISYYINSAPNTDISDKDRIIVNVKGCILTQSREFIVKLGTNRAIKGSRANRADPELKNESGAAYKEKTKSIQVQDESGSVHTKNVGINQYEITDDQFFYDHYVMTDLTLEDSVLETSGLFCIGIESNFAGEVLTDGCSSTRYADMLKKQGWAESGATSFASMLRLVGDVRMYDWKDVSQVDSSTLIESGNGSGALDGILSFNISAMLQEVDGQPEYAKLLYKTDDDKTYVHGGIAYYGGGRNYSLIDLSKFKAELNDLSHININIEQFSTSSNPITSKQTRLLPLASGTHDFNFWLYTADGKNNYLKQENDISTGQKYAGVTSFSLFYE